MLSLTDFNSLIEVFIAFNFAYAGIENVKISIRKSIEKVLTLNRDVTDAKQQFLIASASLKSMGNDVSEALEKEIIRLNNDFNDKYEKYLQINERQKAYFITKLNPLFPLMCLFGIFLLIFNGFNSLTCNETCKIFSLLLIDLSILSYVVIVLGVNLIWKTRRKLFSTIQCSIVLIIGYVAYYYWVSPRLIEYFFENKIDSFDLINNVTIVTTAVLPILPFVFYFLSITLIQLLNNFLIRSAYKRNQKAIRDISNAVDTKLKSEQIIRRYVPESGK